MISDAYAAGLFDGEGSVIINKTNGLTHTLCCTMHLTDLPAISALHERYGGSLNSVKRSTLERGKPIWSWRATGVAAALFLTAVRPFLIIKAAQADLAMEFRRGHLDLHGATTETRSSELERRESFKRQMQRLNGRAA